MFKGDLNDDHEANMRRWEQSFKDVSLDIERLPAIIKESFDRYQDALKEYYERKARANMIFPNPYMTGRSNYTNIEGKRARAGRTEKIGLEKLVHAEKKLKSTLKNYLNHKKLATSKDIDFSAENLNELIRGVRKQYKDHDLIIKKAFGGVRQKRKHTTYYISVLGNQYHLTIDEFGTFDLAHYRKGRIYSKSLGSVREMITELTTFLDNCINGEMTSENYLTKE